jgi:16S rRNA (cytosine1402-N4)-methyltransferase
MISDFESNHIPVLLNEVLEYLNPQTGGVFIDATINGGGHAAALAERIGLSGKLLGIDRDPVLIKKLSEQQAGDKRYTFVCDTFANIRQIAEAHNFTKTNGILFDLGFSSFHIDESQRGFSFQKDEPLDMRYDPTDGISAADIVNSWRADEISELLFTLGEERYGRRIARGIVDDRHHAPIVTTRALVEIIQKAVPARYKRSRIHFATRTFQALRMRVNNELEHVARGVEDAVSLLMTGGRIAVLSFHSGEDRIIKRIFQRMEKEHILHRVVKKPICADREEYKKNPRARSAKLRIAEHI